MLLELQPRLALNPLQRPTHRPIAALHGLTIGAETEVGLSLVVAAQLQSGQSAEIESPRVLASAIDRRGEIVVGPLVITGMIGMHAVAVGDRQHRFFPSLRRAGDEYGRQARADPSSHEPAPLHDLSSETPLPFRRYRPIPGRPAAAPSATVQSAMGRGRHVGKVPAAPRARA